MAYKPRLIIPEKGNPYYNTIKAGGYSDAIQGNPTQTGLNTLSNCVGYAYGRFNEIVGAGKMMYLAPVDAQEFINYMNYRTKGVKSGMKPKLGACAVWSDNKGSGHVAIVEQINTDGSIVTSESGWGCKNPFWVQRRENTDGRWGQGNNYKFLGFIYNPTVADSTPQPTQLKYAVGDIVYFTGNKEYNASTDKNSLKASPCLAKVTQIALGRLHPYHLRHVDSKLKYAPNGVYGWVDSGDVTS